MALTPSTMQDLGTMAPDFDLSGANHKRYSLANQTIDKGLLVVFTCNHCPYVIHIRQQLVEKAKTYQAQGITVVAINSNDFDAYPDDNPVKMASDAKEFGYTFPYLIDDKQKAARDYGAACTPDFFLFDAEKKLVYRGQFDSARPGNDEPVTGADLSRAVDQILAGESIAVDQRPSMGCNIKWKRGNEPEYFTKK
jgi:peroxiredoxin